MWDAAATRPALADIFAPPTGSDPAAFLFSASHGLGFRQPTPDQVTIQGAIKCQDNAGLSTKTLADTPGVHVHGLVAFVLACYGAGTPKEEQYLREVGKPPPLLADKPFIAALPKALLSHPQGGALAYIGHIERLPGTTRSSPPPPNSSSSPTGMRCAASWAACPWATP